MLGETRIRIGDGYKQFREREKSKVVAAADGEVEKEETEESDLSVPTPSSPVEPPIASASSISSIESSLGSIKEFSGRSDCSSSYSPEQVSIDVTMNFSSDLSVSEEYQSFRCAVPLKKVIVDSDSSKVWKLYDAGPRSIRCPLICLAPVSGTADVFYKQILALTARGVRVISVEAPVYWTVNDWCEGFKKLLDHLYIDKVHIFGASLGGFLAQKFAEYTYQYSRVASLVLCNTFCDTSIFNYNESAMVFWMLPSVVLKKLVIGNLTTTERMDLSIAQAIDFMSERLDGLNQQDLASRLTMNCVNSYVDTYKLRQVKITMLDVFDESALSTQARDDLYKSLPHAKMAHLKTGGNFPYLSRSDEVNLHILIHLRTFNETKISAEESKPDISKPLKDVPSNIQSEGDSTLTNEDNEEEKTINQL